MRLSADDTAPDDEEEEEDEEETRRDVLRMSKKKNAATRPRSAETVSPKRRWLDSHTLHHGAGAFIETCRARGHEVVVLGGPGRSAEQCREVLAPPACAWRSDVERATRRRSFVFGSAELRRTERRVSRGCAEYGASRGLAVAAMMHAHEQPWQRWHLVDASLAELSRVAASGFEETSAFTSQFAAWTPALHATRCARSCGTASSSWTTTAFELVGADARRR